MIDEVQRNIAALAGVLPSLGPALLWVVGILVVWRLARGALRR